MSDDKKGKIIIHVGDTSNVEIQTVESGLEDDDIQVEYQEAYQEEEIEVPVKKKKRKHERREVYFDILRILAIFMVLYTQTDSYQLFAECVAGSFGYIFFMMLSVAAYCGPFIFFMISGALLLDKEETLSQVFKKRILRMLCVLVIITVMYYFSDILAGKDKLDIRTFFGDLYAKERIPALWFLYTYLGFLICLPFLRAMAKNMTVKEFLYMTIIVFVISFVFPEFEDKIFYGRYIFNTNFSLGWLTTSIIIYPIAGYFLHKRLSTDMLTKLLPVVWGVNLVVMGIIVYNTKYYTTYTESVRLYTGYFSWGCLSNAFAMFMTARVLFSGKKFGRIPEKVIRSVSGCVMGVYLFHPAVLDRIKFFDNIEAKIFGEVTGPMRIFPCFLWIGVVFTVCLVPTWIIRRLPFAKKIL